MSVLAESLTCVTRRFTILVLPTLRNSLAVVDAKKSRTAPQEQLGNMEWSPWVAVRGAVLSCRAFQGSRTRHALVPGGWSTRCWRRAERGARRAGPHRMPSRRLLHELSVLRPTGHAAWRGCSGQSPHCLQHQLEGVRGAERGGREQLAKRRAWERRSQKLACCVVVSRSRSL